MRLTKPSSLLAVVLIGALQGCILAPKLRLHGPSAKAPETQVATPPEVAEGPTDWKPGDDFRDDQCKSDKDDEGDSVQVCRAQYGQDKTYLAVYWDDDKASIVGPCATQDEIEIKGLEKENAQTWINYYCK
ncbi:MAG: hypothetical protein WCO50_05480 [Synechococcus sp. ELA619]|jgi:hypothetical protein